MRHFLVLVNEEKDPDLKVTERIMAYLKRTGNQVTRVSDELPKEADCMIVLGGDGTMLVAARQTVDRNIPIIGINMVTLGYMAEVEQEDIENALDRLMRGDYLVESRMMLQGQVICGPNSGSKPMKEWALNDIVIARSGPLQIVRIAVYVNGRFLYEFNGDGVIITTPTGSTGYNLSAGGPLVEPQAKLIMLTPICPHTLNQRSIIFSPDDVIEISIPAGRGGIRQTVEASFDGNHRIQLGSGDSVRIMKSEKYTDFVSLYEESFLAKLNKKMG